MKYRRAFAVLTLCVGLYAGFVAIILLTHGFPFAHWLTFQKLAIASASALAAVFLWMGHRYRIATGTVAWLLIATWVAPALVDYAVGAG